MAESKRIAKMQNRLETIWLREDRIIQFVIHSEAEYTLAQAKLSIEGIIQVSQGKRYPILVDMRKVKTMDRATRQKFAAFTGVTAAALLIDSPVSQIIGNFFIAFNKASVPVRLFSTEAEAIRWLKAFIE